MVYLKEMERPKIQGADLMGWGRERSQRKGGRGKSIRFIVLKF